MKLRRIRVRRLPGIEDSFTIEGLSGGLNFIGGRNGSGKTSLCRALRAVLWPGSENLSGMSLVTEWDRGAERWRAELDAGRVRWQRDGQDASPPELPGEALARCFTICMTDLLQDPSGTDEEIAAAVGRSMAGGYDVRAVLRDRFSLGGRHGQAERRALEKARRELLRLRSGDEALRAREEELGGLRDRLEAARAAEGNLAALEAALDLDAARARLRSASEAVSNLPPALARLRGDEGERVRREEDLLAECLAQRAVWEGEVEEARSRLAALGPDAARLDAGEIRRWQARGRVLDDAERLLAEARRARTVAEAGRDTARRQLAGGGGGNARTVPRVDRSALVRVRALLRRSQSLEHEISALEARRAVLEAGASNAGSADARAAAGGGVNPDASSRSGASARTLAAVSQDLRAWLAADRTLAALRWSWLMPVAGLALIGLAWGFHDRLAGSGDLLLGGAIGLLAGSVVVDVARYRASVRRRHLRAGLEERGVRHPGRWTRSEVQQLADELEEEYACAVFERREADVRLGLDAEEERLTRACEEIAVERAALLDELGIAASDSDFDLCLLLERVTRLEEADAALAEAEGFVEESLARYEAERGEICAFLTRYGEAAVADAKAAEECLAALQERAVLRERAELRLGEARRAEADAARKESDLRQRIAAIYRGVGLAAGAREELDALLRRLDELATARDARRGAAEHARGLEGRVRELDPSLLELGHCELEERQSLARERARCREGLAAEIRSVEEAIDRRRREDSLERALAEEAACESALAARRDEALLVAAGRFLLARAADRFDREQRPHVLECATRLFDRFTRHRYELTVDTGGERPTFRAVDTQEGAGRALGELSCATRMQLLLAARLSFAREAEKGEPLPIVLDEVLTTSDPERFRAVAGCVAAMLREEERQVFYLSSRPDEGASWRRVLEENGVSAYAVFDLDRLRDDVQTPFARVHPRLYPRVAVPSPHGVEPAEFARRIDVPALDARRALGRLHLFELLAGDLDLLERLLTEGISTVGHWRAAAAAGTTARFEETERQRLEALIDLGGMFLEAWKIGRGRRLEPESLDHAGLNEIWVERLGALVREAGGDARTLLDAFVAGDERTKRFPRAQLERLGSYLRGMGYIDEREVLDEEGVRAYCIRGMSSHMDSGHVARGEVEDIVRSLWQRVEAHAVEASR